MEEIKVKNNMLGLKVYAVGEPETSGEGYDLLVSSFADKLDELFDAKNGLTCIYTKRTPCAHNPNFLTVDEEVKP